MQISFVCVCLHLHTQTHAYMHTHIHLYIYKKTNHFLSLHKAFSLWNTYQVKWQTIFFYPTFICAGSWQPSAGNPFYSRSPWSNVYHPHDCRANSHSRACPLLFGKGKYYMGKTYTIAIQFYWKDKTMFFIFNIHHFSFHEGGKPTKK